MKISSVKNDSITTVNGGRFLSPLLTAAMLSAMAVSMPLMAEHHASDGASAQASTNVGVSGNQQASFSGRISGVSSTMVNGQQMTFVTLSGANNTVLKANLGQLSKQQRRQLMLDDQLDVKGTIGSDGHLIVSQANLSGESFLKRSDAEIASSMTKSENLTKSAIGEFAGFGGSVNKALQSKAADGVSNGATMADDAKVKTEDRAKTQAETNAELGIGSSNDAEGGTVLGSAVGTAVGANRVAKMQVGEKSAAAMAEANAGKKNFTGIVSDVKTAGDKAMIAVTSGTNQTVETEISGMQAQKPDLIKKGDRASITGDIKADGKVAAERVIVSGGAVVAEKTPAKLVKAGAGAARVVDQKGGAMSGTGSAAASATNKTASATVTSVLNTGVSVGGGLLGGASAASSSMAGEAKSQGMAVKDGVTNQVDKLTAVPSKQNYSGVIQSYEMINVDDEEHVMVTLKSGADRTVMADLGQLSEAKIAQLQTGVRMDVVGKVDSSNIVDTETANLSGKLFVKIAR